MYASHKKANNISQCGVLSYVYNMKLVKNSAVLCGIDSVLERFVENMVTDIAQWIGISWKCQ